MKAKEILTQAADRIAKLGWCQGSYGLDTAGKPTRARKMGFQSDVVQTDLLGAIRYIDDGDESDKAKGLVQKLLGDVNLAEWNDDPERTQAEVIAALRKAAK